MQTSRSSQSGSALVYVVFTMTVLLAASAAVLRPVSDEYGNTFRTASWQEALLAAESGIDLATMQLRQNLSQPGADWPGPWTAQLDGSHTRSTSYTHAGEGGNTQSLDVTIDSPLGLVDPRTGWQYYRIRSKGTISFGGNHRAGGERRDLDLRKLSLVRDRFNGTFVARPQVSRMVEAIVRPSSAFPVALLSKSSTTISNQNVIVDSYDSSDPNKSTNGQYDVAKRQQKGDVATDGTLIAAGNAHIYGNVSTNGGTVTGVQNITGTIRSDYYQDIPSTSAPAWPTYTPAIARSTTTLTGSPIKGAARYKLSDITLSGLSVLTLQTSGTGMNYIEIWVDGDVSVSGNAAVLLAKNLTASFYVAGNMAIGGNGVGNSPGLNPTGYERPANLLIYGLKPTDGSSRSIKLNGNADIESGVYAPDADVEIVGGGANGDFAGSVVGKTIFMNGVTQAHYDESLSASGVVVGYRIVSWMEDTR